FGKLPVAYNGRTQPMDTLARNALRTLSGKSTYVDKRYDEPQPAVRWLLDEITQSPAALDHQIIRIDNLDVLQTLGLKPRAGLRYSEAEIMGDDTPEHPSEMRRQADLAENVPEDKRDLTQQKFHELNAKLNLVMMLRGAFTMPDFGKDGKDFLARVPRLEQAIVALNHEAPRPVPPASPDAPWQTLFEASFDIVRDGIVFQKQPAPDNGATQLLGILDAYRDGQTADFNSKLDTYGNLLAKTASAEATHEADL